MGMPGGGGGSAVADQSNQLSQEQAEFNRQQAATAAAEAARIRQEEAARQARVTAAISEINDLFGPGGWYTPPPDYGPNDPLPGAGTYYNQSGTPVRYAGDVPAPLAAFFGPRTIATERPQGNLWAAPPRSVWRGGTFNDAFFNNRAREYENYYLPQVEDQYEDASTQLGYNLARAGINRSTAANEAREKLARDKALREAEVRSRGAQQASNLRSQVDQTRRNLIAQAEASENPGGIASLGAQQVNSLSATPLDLSPLGDLFAGAIQGYGAYRSGRDAEEAAEYVRQGVQAPGLPTGGSGTRIG